VASHLVELRQFASFNAAVDEFYGCLAVDKEAVAEGRERAAAWQKVRY
jgi:hypothetical protein